MSANRRNLTPQELNEVFISYLGPAVQCVINPKGKPLELDVQLTSHFAKLRVYLFNCTNPPGGRAPDEFKTQLTVPGQKRGERGQLFYGGDRIVLLGAYARLGTTTEDHVFVFWDATCHNEFAYSSNIQVKTDILISALVKGVTIGRRTSGETIVACTPTHLKEGVETRLLTVSDC